MIKGNVRIVRHRKRKIESRGKKNIKLRQALRCWKKQRREKEGILIKKGEWVLQDAESRRLKHRNRFGWGKGGRNTGAPARGRIKLRQEVKQCPSEGKRRWSMKPPAGCAAGKRSRKGTLVGDGGKEKEKKRRMTE